MIDIRIRKTWDCRAIAKRRSCKRKEVAMVIKKMREAFVWYLYKKGGQAKFNCDPCAQLQSWSYMINNIYSIDQNGLSWLFDQVIVPLNKGRFDP